MPDPGDRRAASSPGRRNPIRLAAHRFWSDPASSRNAIILIVVAQLATVVVGGAIIWLFDRQEFEQLTEGLWYILQTVTTVGYGDVTPTDPIGRAVGAIVMLVGIASLSILTALITSSFVEARQAARRISQDAEEDARWARLEAQLRGMAERLERIDGPRAPPHEALGGVGQGPADAHPPARNPG
jgi:voltage-gated potassium channel